MKVSRKQLISFGGGLVWALLAATSAQSQDIELFLGNAAAQTAAKPNILLILDDSGSMDGAVTSQLSYDPATTYASQGCDINRVYWSRNGTPPACATNNWFDLSALVCKRALDVFGSRFGGNYTDHMAQYDDGVQARWEDISDLEKTRLVECQDDRPDALSGWPGHGDGSSATAVYATNGNPVAKWGTSFNQEVSWGQSPTDNVYTIYAGNYLNWYYGPPVNTTRIEVMKDVASSLVSSINGVNFGLMSFGDSEQGGRVQHAIEDVTTGRAAMLNAIDALQPSNYTPLSETLHEAYQYLSGDTVIYGGAGDSAAFVSSGSSTKTYQSPISLSCQKTHVVLLSDGEPRRDHDSTPLIPNLTDATGASFSSLVPLTNGTCDLETYPTGLSGDGGECLDDLAEFMYDGDISPLQDRQNVITHTVGFLINLPILQETATRGGGEYRTASDTASLTSALTSIITSILQTQATFTAPALSINSFNQTRNLDDIYISLFEPSGTTHWPGNLKKYRLRASDATIVDANDNPLMVPDPQTGKPVISSTAQSFWSQSVDGDDIEAGGAASLIPNPRKVYTYFGNPDLKNSANAIASNNGSLTDAVLNTGTAGQPTRTEVIDFINGLVDSDNDGILEQRLEMGDPLHAPPAPVIYGPTTDDGRIYFATNDGYLHSIDTRTGVEQWAFLPPEFLDRQAEFYKDNQVAAGFKLYGVDGHLSVHIIGDNDGVVEANRGEKVFLYVGMRRGGDFYYALDVTAPDNPQLIWRHDSSSLPNAGQSWPQPIPARINIQGAPYAANNPDRHVLVIGGGYDPSQDFNFTSTDSAGNSIYIVDALNGNLLWHGSRTGTHKNFDVSGKAMDYSFASAPRVIDLNGDQFADRMYAADMGGQIWRFDIVNGQSASSLVNGGVVAQLGAAGLANPTLQETRRFYYTPDVALASTADYSFIHIGIGSGYRAHPNDTNNQNRFYALRDYTTFGAKTQAQYDAFTPIIDADLVDVTTNTSASVPQGSPGWKLQLNDGGWIGEKVLAETRTFNNNVYVTTFRPGVTGAGCAPALGTNRQYIMSLFDGSPVFNLDASTSGPLDENDRYTEWEGAPPPETVFIFADDPACVGASCPPVQCVDVNCGLSTFQNFPKRTFWNEESLD